MREIKLFTLEEANALIPFLEEKMTDLRTLRSALMTLEIEIDALELVVEKDAGGKSPLIEQKVAGYYGKVDEFYRLVEEVHEHGCLIKDAEQGLVDFYMMHEGEVVFLCWKSGEEKAAHWHEINSGFMSRKPLLPSTFDPETPQG